MLCVSPPPPKTGRAALVDLLLLGGGGGWNTLRGGCGAIMGPLLWDHYYGIVVVGPLCSGT